MILTRVDPLQHPLVIDLLMCGVLIDDEHLLFILHDPVCIEYLSDDPVLCSLALIKKVVFEKLLLLKVGIFQKLRSRIGFT